jgi:hypothetical protein
VADTILFKVSLQYIIHRKYHKIHTRPEAFLVQSLRSEGLCFSGTDCSKQKFAKTEIRIWTLWINGFGYKDKISASLKAKMVV